MAKSKFEYVKLFERSDVLLPNTWIVIRIDGRSFTRFTTEHAFGKPNDMKGLQLMVDSAKHVMREIRDITLSYGESDEFSFLIPPTSELYQRREAKLTSSVVSLFTSNYVFRWSQFFPDKPLQYPPSFDGRAVCYPDMKNVRDYFSWRQADTHINNLQNTCLWNLVKPPPSTKPEFSAGMTTKEAQQFILENAPDSGRKNELLFARFGINYNAEPALFRKGSVVYYKEVPGDHVEGTAEGGEAESAAQVGSWDAKPEAANQQQQPSSRRQAPKKKKKRRELVEDSVDIIGDAFWKENPYLLER